GSGHREQTLNALTEFAGVHTAQTTRALFATQKTPVTSRPQARTLSSQIGRETYRFLSPDPARGPVRRTRISLFRSAPASPFLAHRVRARCLKMGRAHIDSDMRRRKT